MDQHPGLTGRAIDGIPAGRYLTRMAWVAIRIVAATYLGFRGSEFFYQGF